jgi:transposase-like protein
MLETNTLLVKCPHCGAWPMAANLPKPASAHREQRLRCAKCHHQQSVRLRRPAAARRVPHRPRDLDAA